MWLLRRVAAAVVPLLVIVAVAAAEEPFPYPAGEKQVIFGFSGWNPQVHEGGLGFRFFHANRWATDLVVTGSVRSGRRDRSYPPDGGTSVSDYEQISLGLVLGAEKYLITFYRITPYLGLGFGYTYSWRDRLDTRSTDGEQDVSTYSGRTHDAGLHGKLGAEWAFTEGMTLGVRYVVRFSREWWSEEIVYYSGSRAEEDGHEWALRMGAGLLTLSVRF